MPDETDREPTLDDLLDALIGIKENTREIKRLLGETGKFIESETSKGD